MKYSLLFVIRLYWWLIPTGKRRSCIYRKSCSRYVYDVTDDKGLLAGLRALTNRVNTCRPNHEIIYLDKEHTLLIKLANGTILQQDEISESIVSLYESKLSIRN